MNVKNNKRRLETQQKLEAAFFAAERAKIDEAQAICDETQGKLDELVRNKLQRVASLLII